MNVCSQLMNDSGIEVGKTHNLEITFRFPDLSHQISENQTVAEKRYVDESKLNKFKNLIRKFRKDPEGNLLTLNELAKEIEVSFKWDLFEKILHINLFSFDYFSTS